MKSKDKNKLRAKRIAALLICAVMIFSAGCTLPGTNFQSNEIPESTQGKDKTMAKAADDVFSLNFNTKYSFNPLIATNHSNQLVCALVYENMVELDNNFEVIPNIITEWEYNDDASLWTFKIDTNHYFHDGTQMTAKDLRYSLDRAINCDRYAGRFSAYQGSDFWGDDTLTVTLGVGNTQFVKLLNIPVIKSGSFDEKYPEGSGPYAYEFNIIQEDTGKKDEEDNPIMTEKLVPKLLKASEFYPGYKKLPLDTIYLKEYTKAVEVLNAFEDSYIDLVVNDPSSYTNLGYASSNEIHTFATSNMHYAVFNQESPIFASAGIRYALQFAFDREYLVTLLHNNAVASPLPLYPTATYYPDTLADKLEKDLAKCKTMLENNGVRDYDEDGFMEMLNGTSDDLTINFILCSDSSAKVGVVNRFKDDMLSIGIKVNVIELTWEDYYNALTDYEALTKEQKEAEDFEEVEYDMYYAEVKLRNDFDISEIIQPRTDRNKYKSVNFSKSTDSGYETLLYNYLAASDANRKDRYNEFCEYILCTNPSIIVIGFEKQQIITHQGAIRGIDANIGNPLYNFPNWQIKLKPED